MQMHRISGRADWANVKQADRNGWQRLASRTHGSVTPGNAVTVIGAGIATVALVLITQHHYWVGVALLAVGRLCDLLDGYLADLTGTKGPIGELLDVVADKLISLGCAIVFLVAHIMPLWLLVGLAAPQFITVGVKVLFAAHKPIRPTRSGKISMALLWLCLLGFLLDQATGTHALVRTVAYVLGFASILVGLYANRAYYDEARAK